jgi:DNA invertase Pin-like site-specific DNA recombinase
MGELVAYMRVSTKEQKFDLQRDALRAAGVADRYVYQDIASGAQQARLGLDACLKALHPGDTLVVWKLDRIARSLLHLLEILQDLHERQVGLRILEGIGAQMNPATSEGKLFLSMLGAFAEFERTLIRERVVAGLAAARERGHVGGRRPRLTAAQQREAQVLKRGGMSVTEIARKFGCARQTVYKCLAQAPQPQTDTDGCADPGVPYGEAAD